MRFPLIAIVLTVGCAPPDIPKQFGDTGGGGGAPAVRVVFPPSDVDLPLTSAVAPEGPCKITTVVAIDVDNFTVTKNTDEDIDGQGHWHLQLLDEPYFPVLDQYGELTSQETYKPGALVQISAELVTGTHQSFTPPITNLTEFTIVAPLDGTDCSL